MMLTIAPDICELDVPKTREGEDVDSALRAETVRRSDCFLARQAAEEDASLTGSASVDLNNVPHVKEKRGL
jgi:hypothetical protein